MSKQLVNVTELAFAAEHACGPPYTLRAAILPARKDGRPTKPGEVARLWAAYFKDRHG